MKQSFKERLAARAFNHNDFVKADRLTKIYMAMVDPDNFELNQEDEIYAKRIHECFQLLSQEYRQISVVKKFLELHPEFNHSRALKLIQDTQEIYGSITKRNAFFDLITQRERLLKHLENLDNSSEYQDDDSVIQYKSSSTYDAIIKLETLISKLDERISQMQPEEKGLMGGQNEYQLPIIQLSADLSLLNPAHDDSEE